jgi:hopanoid-associated phosphorylase
MLGIGVICGLQREARCLQGVAAGPHLQIICSGADSGRAREAADRLASRGCRGLVSFGLAGGLAPDLKPGTLIAADAVVGADGRRRPVDAAWLGGFKNALPDDLDVIGGLLAGVDGPLITPAAKSDLAGSSGAVAADMESHAVAAAAAAADIPFLVVRAIADPAARAVPEWVMGGVDRQGRVRLGVMIAGVLIRPWSIPELIGLASDSSKAYAALSRVAFHAGTTFGGL